MKVTHVIDLDGLSKYHAVHSAYNLTVEVCCIGNRQVITRDLRRYHRTFPMILKVGASVTRDYGILLCLDVK